MLNKNYLRGYSNKNFILYLIIFLFIACSYLTAQTSGKLSGRVTDENGEPLVGANVLIDGTTQGAATDFEGYYSILNVRPGTYTVNFRYIGYQTKIIQNIIVNADRTTNLDITLSPEAIEGETVTITAERPIVEFNQTSSIATVTKDDIENLPVQSLSEIVNLQAGVISDADGTAHFRGGRGGEVQYQVDGVTVNNPYDNTSTLRLDRSLIEEVQVISGTFDAKYGQAMSGVVNAVLRSGSNNFEVYTEVYGGDYYTADKDRYPHNKKFTPYGIQNYQLTISGPTGLPNTTFFASGRRYTNDGWLFGERRFLPTDTSNFETRDFYPTGDNELVPMDDHKEWSGQFKVTNRSLDKLVFSYQAIGNYIKTHGGSGLGNYDHPFRLNPDGIKEQETVSLTHGLDITHTLSDKMFYKLSFRQNYFDYKDYKYEDVFDPRYLQAGQPKSDAIYEAGANLQGVDIGRFIQKTDSYIAKLDYTWQLDRSNFIEAGVEGQTYIVDFGSPGFLRATSEGGVQILRPYIGTLPEDPKVEQYKPNQIAAYLQDRVELGDLVVRAGLRFEYFDAQAHIPSDLQNPANSIRDVPLSHPQQTTEKISIAPRLGFSFPLTDMASLYFSYGHFYQMPNLEHLYRNSNYFVLDDLQAGGIEYGALGNPDLKPQQTIQYEVGLKQALTNSLGLELTFFYKDIRDLLGTEFVATYAAAEYARFTNVDFGSVFGFTFAIDQRQIGPISTTLDYTMQFARGNSSDPRETANRAEGGKDPRPRDIPFNWDQRHTLNATALYYVPNDFSISTIIKYGSGQPYTPQIGVGGFNADLETNEGNKPSFVLVDLRAEKFFNLGIADISLFIRVFNLLNTNTVNGFVFAGTGSPDYSLNPSGNRSELINPDRYYNPRRIEFGISFRSN